MQVITRYLTRIVREDALNLGKMAFLSGPRQAGKSTIGRSLLAHEANEFTWDDEDFRRAWIKSPSAALAAREGGPILLDEIHKDVRWKQKIKGIYDTARQSFPIVVTGSARLDIFRKGGDSLLGRYFPYHVHPFSVGETEAPPTPDEIFSKTAASFPLADILKLGTFPEPLLDGSEARARRWSRLRRERLVTEDVRDLRNIQNLRQLALLVELLPSRVGSLLSVNNLRQDLAVAHDTVSAWIETLASVYLCFRIKPWSKKISRAIRAEPKLYLFDLLQVPEGGPRMENLVALHLLKACDYWTDSALDEISLHFIRNRDGQEVDFLVIRNDQPWMLVEVKSNDTNPTGALIKYAAALGTDLNFQLVSKTGYRRTYPDLRITVISAETFLAGLV
ncbi:MAG: AAA family ATPase [Candidatus Ozemobacteraceae bacterium]